MICRRDVVAASVAGLLIAAGLFWLALPRLGAQSVALSGDRTFERVLHGAEVGRGETRALAASRERALRWADDPALAFQLSEVYRSLWRTAPPSATGAAAIRTRDATLRELAARPLSARAWWRLALADYTLAGRPTGRSRDAVAMSLAVQENAMTLVPVRLGLLLRHWPMFTPQQRETVKRQVPIAWRYDRKTVLALARNDVRRILIRAALVRDAGALAAFERALAAAARAE